MDKQAFLDGGAANMAALANALRTQDTTAIGQFVSARLAAPVTAETVPWPDYLSLLVAINPFWPQGPLTLAQDLDAAIGAL